jgi:hypothetical protein
MGQKCLALGTVLFFGITNALPARAQLLVIPDVDKLCQSAAAETHRNTIVYVDLSSIKKGVDEWGYTILRKLQLTPREHLTVLGVDPTSFEVLEVFDSCYPILSPNEITQIRNKRSWWEWLTRSDPETQQRDNLQTFDSRLRIALDRIEAQASKFVTGQRRNILGAIAVDKNRFTKRDAYYRMIIFTNGVVSDDILAGSDEWQIADALTKKYPTSFSGAEVWVFGATGGDSNAPLEAKEKIFSAFFLRNGAHVQSFALSLPQQTNRLYAALSVFNGTFEGGGIKGSVKLAFATTDEQAAKVWLAFIVGATVVYVPMEGSYSCSQGNCTLKGAALENVPVHSTDFFFRKGDQLILKGTTSDKLEGTLSAETGEVFEGGGPNELAKYKLEVSKQ